MSSSSPRRSWLNSRMVGWFIGMAAAFAVMYFSLGKKQPVGNGEPISQSGGPSSSGNSLCENKLTKWIQSVDPERLQFNTDIESRVQELNRYWTTCGATGDEPIVSDLKPIETAVPGEYLDRVLSPRFGRRDVEHIRQSLLLSQIALRIGETQKTDLTRALAAMALVSQQTEPLAADSAVVRPLTPFECLLLGEGTPADRAWIFAEILRQLHLDVVVLTAKDAAIQPLVGVVIESEVYLFEPLTGLPIPSAGESQRKTLFREPATLKAALAEDSILRQFDLEGAPFPWTAEQLKAATVGLVGTSSTWAPRAAELQFQWPTGQTCVIFDGLGASAGLKRGLVERVSDVLTPLGYTAESIQVWEYPEQQCVLYDSLGAEESPQMVPLVAVMSGPTNFEEVQDPQTGQWTVYSQRAKQTLQQARVQHLLSHRIEAIGGYLPLMRAHLATPKQSGKIDGAVQTAMDQNRVVADKATYWMAATQFENNDIEACVSTLKRYSREFPLGGMREAAAMRLAACLLKTEQFEPASQVLAGIGPGPNQIRRMLLARRILELSQTLSPASVMPPTELLPQPPVVPPANEPVPPPTPEVLPK